MVLIARMSVISHMVADLQVPPSVRVGQSECVVRIPHSTLHSWRLEKLAANKRVSYVELFLRDTPLPFIHLKQEAHRLVERRLETVAISINKKIRKSNHSKTDVFAGKQKEQTCRISQ